MKHKALDPFLQKPTLSPQEVGYTVSDPKKVTYEQFMALDDPDGREVAGRGFTRASADAPREYYKNIRSPC